MKIANQYLVNTKYGINLLVLTENGEYYLQVHSALCHDGGGIATWEKIDSDAAKNLIP